MKRAFLLLSLLSVPALADDAPVPAPVAPVTTPSFLSSRGVVSGDELLDVLGAKLSPEKRAEFDRALAKRNAALAKANEELTATMRDLLAQNDEGLAKLVDESAEAKRMEWMRRAQPSRWQEIMNRKRKAAKKAAERVAAEQAAQK